MNWRSIDPPSKKSDFVGKFLALNEDAPPVWFNDGNPMPQFRPKSGDIVRIARRMNAKDASLSVLDVSSWGNIRILKIEILCKTCGTIHQAFIPESWIAENKACFVEEIDA